MTSGAAMARLECRDLSRMLGPYLDGELDTSTLLEVETHVGDCETCRERIELDRSTRASLKRTVRTAAPESLRARVGAAMAAEQARTDVRLREASRGLASRAFGWGTVVPLASAAALALAWGFQSRYPRANDVDAIHAGFGGDDLLSEFIAEHSRPLPPERTDPKEVRALEQYIGVPVHPGLENAGAKLVGGRVLPVHQQRAAMLQYVVGTGPTARRVSVFVYDPNKIRIGGPELSPRAVGSAEVRVGHANGYSVAVTQREGVGYVLAGDVDTDRASELVASPDTK